MQKHHNSGYTLIEAIIALVIISFGLVTALGLFNKSLLRHHEARQITKASIHASNLIQSETYKLLPSTLGAIPQVQEASPSFSVIKDLSTTSLPGVSKLDIYVTWGEGDNESVRASGFIPAVTNE